MSYVGHPFKGRQRVFACDTEVANIEVKEQTPVGHGTVICFSVYAGPDADFNVTGAGGAQPRLWVDLMGFLRARWGAGWGVRCCRACEQGWRSADGWCGITWCVQFAWQPASAHSAAAIQHVPASRV